MKLLRKLLRLMAQLFVAVGVLSFLSTPSHAGAYEDFFKAVEMDDGRTILSLLRRGFDVNSPSETGQTALFLALRGEAFQAATALLSAPDIKIDQINHKVLRYPGEPGVL